MKKLILFIGVATIVSMVLLACTDVNISAEETETTLSIVQERGALVCGITTGVPGYSAPDSNNVWRGFDVDLCRAVAAAVFGDPEKVEYRPLSAKERFTALQSGEIDVLSRVTTWTLSRDTSLGLNFAGVNYYDGQGFIVKKSGGVQNLQELDNASICVQSGTTTELNLADYFSKNRMKFNLTTFDRNEQASAAFESGRCDAFTSDQSQLYALRTKFANPDDFQILPELISKEPLGPVVRQGDDQWFDLVKWTLIAMVNAEELEISSSNVDSQKSSDNPTVRRLLGIEGDFGVNLGVSNDWAYNIIKMVGNYGEAFENNLGSNSPLKIERGYNALWTQGGLQYGYPVR